MRLSLGKNFITSLLVGLLLCSSALAVDPTAKRIQTDVSAFNKNLSSSDTTVQKALETLDDMTAGISDAPSDGTTYGRKDGSWTGISFALEKNAPATKTIVFYGDYRGQYVFSSVKKLPYQENGAGITITSITVSSDVTPTTQLNLSINYCDAQVTNFPGANIVNLSTFTTTAGAYSSGVISYQVPSGYPLYVLFNADPTDFGIPWQLKLTYTVN